MQLDYAIEEMLLQSPTLVVYKARGRNGFRYAISRFIYTKSVLSNLKEACFESALKELKRLTHGCLRPVIDGGLDDIDGMPWVARVWWDGEFLDDRIKKGVMTPADIQRLADHGQSLIDALGDRAAAVSFKSRDVILTTGRGGQPVETFNVDVKNWFRDWAMGMPPGAGKNAHSELGKLVMEAEMAQMAPQQEAQYAHQQLAIPQPPPTQVMVAPPPITQPLIPAPAPTGPLMPAVANLPGAVPAPPLTVPLMPAAGQGQAGIPAPPPTGPLIPFSDPSAIPAPAPSGQLNPGPPPSGPLMPMPGVAQAGVPAPAPSGLLIPGPPPSGPMIPAPSPSQLLVQGPHQQQGQPQPVVPMVGSKLIFQQPGQAKKLVLH